MSFRALLAAPGVHEAIVRQLGVDGVYVFSTVADGVGLGVRFGYSSAQVIVPLDDIRKSTSLIDLMMRNLLELTRVLFRKIGNPVLDSIEFMPPNKLDADMIKYMEYKMNSVVAAFMVPAELAPGNEEPSKPANRFAAIFEEMKNS